MYCTLLQSNLCMPVLSGGVMPASTLTTALMCIVIAICAVVIISYLRLDLVNLKQRNADKLKQMNDYRKIQREHLMQTENLVGSFVLNLTDGTCVGYFSPGEDFSGSTEACTQLTLKRLHPDDADRFVSQMSGEALLRAYGSGATNVTADFLFFHSGHGYVWRRLVARFVRNPNTNAVEAVCSALDIDHEKRIQQVGRKIIYEDFSHMALIDTESGSSLLFVHRRTDDDPAKDAPAKLLELDYDTGIIPDFIRIMHPQEYRDLSHAIQLCTIRKKLAQSPKYTVSLRTKPDKSGTIHYYKLEYSYLSPLKERILLTYVDVSDVVSGGIDPLTGLYNASGFYTRVKEWFAAHPGQKYMLLRYDFAGFKFINASFGYDAGNELLRNFGLFMHEHNTADTFGAHLSGDHFIRFCGDDSIIPEQINPMFRAKYQDYPYPLTLHIGVYDLCEDNHDPYIMSYKALLALQTIKNNLTTHVAYYRAEMLDSSEKAQKLLGNVESALHEEQFKVWFQPQYDCTTHRLSGAEALIRWQHPQNGMISPGEFIPLLEHSNLITEVDRYIWEKTCKYLHDWNAMGLTLPVSVNISRMDLYKTDLPEYFTELVRRYDLQPAQLRLEITESACMDKADQLISMVNRFRAAGFTVEIDDFGSGYSSLNTLKDVHADILKLDMQFLAGNNNTPRSRQILSFVINMAHALSMEVIAEGVETQEQSDVLQAMGCRYMQGYFYGRPMPAGAFEQLMEAALKNTDTKR